MPVITRKPRKPSIFQKSGKTVKTGKPCLTSKLISTRIIASKFCACACGVYVCVCRSSKGIADSIMNKPFYITSRPELRLRLFPYIQHSTHTYIVYTTFITHVHCVYNISTNTYIVYTTFNTRVHYHRKAHSLTVALTRYATTSPATSHHSHSHPQISITHPSPPLKHPVPALYATS